MTEKEFESRDAAFKELRFEVELAKKERKSLFERLQAMSVRLDKAAKAFKQLDMEMRVFNEHVADWKPAEVNNGNQDSKATEGTDTTSDG